jgi:hypothetical protein
MKTSDSVMFSNFEHVHPTAQLGFHFGGLLRKRLTIVIQANYVMTLPGELI